MPPPLPLAGRTALVTGAASGIGLAVATRLADDGARLLLLDREEGAVKQAADDLAARGHDVEHLVADLGDPDAVEALGLGSRVHADVLVNNAGLQRVAPVVDLDPADFALIHRVMLQAPFLLARALLPGMYERGWGRLVHVSSAHGHRASPYKAAYVSAKHGLEGLSKVIALEAAEHGVTSNTVCPGYVRTPLVEGQIADQAERHGIDPDDVVADVLLARSAVKRLVEPAEVADLVAFLCGPSGASITGSSHLMDGGWTAA